MRKNSFNLSSYFTDCGIWYISIFNEMKKFFIMLDMLIVLAFIVLCAAISIENGMMRLRGAKNLCGQ